MKVQTEVLRVKHLPADRKKVKKKQTNNVIRKTISETLALS